MGLMLKKQRDGSLRGCWYGVYTEADGTRKVVNLDLPWLGTPPASGRVGDTGDRDFEASREKAQEVLARYMEDARRKGRAEHLTERLIEAKTGRAVKYTRLDELPRRWRSLGREDDVTEAYLVNCDAHFRRFIAFMRSENTAATYLYEITPEDAASFVRDLRGQLASSTAQYGVRLVRKALSRLLPVGAQNPFENFVGRRGKGESGVVHRRPFTEEELLSILAVAKNDSFMYPLIVTAACTGMRRGDVCNLSWRDVDLAESMLTVKTSKDEGNVEIPIFKPLQDVLEALGGKGRGHVFPKAAAMLKDNPDKLTWEFKKIIARALDPHIADDVPPPVPAVEIAAEGIDAIRENVSEGARRYRMSETFQRYCAGESVRAIEKRVGCSRSTVSADLRAVEAWIGKTFMRRGAGRHSKSSITAAVARTTRIKRNRGRLSASVLDWHALRTTFVTLALSEGVAVEIVQRVTGHKTVKVVMDNYFRPDRDQFRAILIAALPDVLTGGKPKRANPGDELVDIAAKVASGTATDKDKARLRKLAATV